MPSNRISASAEDWESETPTLPTSAARHGISGIESALSRQIEGDGKPGLTRLQ